MKAAPIPSDEVARLKALHDYAILDTRSEQDFDDLTQLAAHICGSPIALVSLVDKDRQWFKSRVGLDASETPRDLAFCAHAILHDEIFEVPNALEDDRFSDNPLVTSDPSIRFYAGAPLNSPSGHNIGTLCVIDRVPRNLSEAQRTALEALSRQVVTQLELRKNLMALKDAIDELDESKLSLTELNRELERKRVEAEAASLSKSNFLANMSHELRTPLNAIIGYSEMLEEEVVDLGQQDLAPDLQKIRSSGIHLLELINDILDLSKIEAGRMSLHCEEFDLEATLNEICDTSQPLIGKNDNTLERDFALSSIVMFSDRTKIRQCIFNLLSNAAKFTKNGRIGIGARAIQSNGASRVKIIVEDSGIGMTEEQCAKIFDSFTQADESTTRNYGGTGLGLTITKRICEMMKGDISVVSTPGSGTKFTIDIPLRVEEHTNEPNVSTLGTVDTPEHSTRAELDDRPTILVIDDDPAARDLIRRHMISEGYQVTLAESGERGLELARRSKPDMITLDVMMPGMDGWEVLVRLKEDESLAAIPVVMVSMVSNQDIGFAIGASDYLTKPVSRERLVTVLRKHIAESTPDDFVLVVEDDGDARQLASTRLVKEGYKVREAINGRAALETLESDLPCLVLLDLMMPEMDGFTLLEKMKADSRFADIPVIILTAKDLTSADRERLNGMAADILSKGSTGQKELLTSITSALRRANADKA